MVNCPFDSCNGKTFIHQGALNLHLKKKHPPTVQVISQSPVDSSPVPEGRVTFYSPKAHALQIVVKPSEWIFVDTPVGSRTVATEGVTVQFEAGRFVTADPILIDYLENKYEDRRFPVLSSRKMREMALAERE